MAFTTIDHDLRRSFNLTLNEYAIADSIYFLSRGGSVCTASKKYLGDFIGVSKQSVHSILNKLESKNIIFRTKEGVKTSDLWDNEIIKIHGLGSKESLPKGKESLPGGVKKVDSDGKESLHNNNSIPTTNKYIIKEFIDLAEYFYNALITNVNPPSFKNKKPDLNKWAITFGKMIRLDKYNSIDIKQVIDWTVKDDFWKVNILSPNKLREKYDKLYLSSLPKKMPKASWE